MNLSALRGRRLLVPVTAERRHLAERLAAAGASVEEVELIAIAPTEDRVALEEATLAWCAGDFDWMAVTSRNAVLAMHAIAREHGTTLSAPQPDARVATVGEATRQVCADLGLEITLVPERQANARGIVAEFPEGTGRVLAPLGNLASPVLERGLARKGWDVHPVEAYRTVDGSGVGRDTREELAAGGFDAVLLTSGSVAERLAGAVAEVPDGTAVVAIGDTTAASARAQGLTVTAVAQAPSYDGIVAGLIVALTETPEDEPRPEDAGEATDEHLDAELEDASANQEDPIQEDDAIRAGESAGDGDATDEAVASEQAPEQAPEPEASADVEQE